jgi:hypothetical protein
LRRGIDWQSRLHRILHWQEYGAHALVNASGRAEQYAARQDDDSHDCEHLQGADIGFSSGGNDNDELRPGF